LDVDLLPDELAISVLTVGELRAGVLAASAVGVRDQRLGTLTAALQLDPVPVDEAVAAEWARLRVLLRDSGQRMPVNDSWIAATAIALGVPVVTQEGASNTSSSERRRPVIPPRLLRTAFRTMGHWRKGQTRWENEPSTASSVTTAPST
jgi:predicted nucleic acid-binding protein